MIKGDVVFHLRGDFRKQTPQPVRYSVKIKGEWFVITNTPRSSYHHKVTDFDAKGEAWLIANEKKDAPPPEPEQTSLL